MPWFAETLHRSVRQTLAVRRPIATETTAFQKMKIIETEAYGRALVLDGVVQTTERDEHIYHEMMTHVPLFAHKHPTRVLIIGGGDGGIAREVLRHKSVEAVSMVEIDPGVIEACKRHLPSICADAFEDPRLDVVVDDGAKFVRTTSERYDVAIIDSPDPIGPATVLFAIEFYKNISRVLRPGGLMVRQTGSLFLQPDESVEAAARLRRVFKFVSPYVAAIPTYIGGLFGFLMASNTVQPLRATPASLESRYRRARFACQYYTPAIHRACFALPASVRARLAPL